MTKQLRDDQQTVLRERGNMTERMNSKVQGRRVINPESVKALRQYVHVY